jgi:hypothetical protein
MFRRALLSAILLVSVFAAPAAAQTAEPPTGFDQLAIDTDQVTDRVGLVDPATGTWHLRGAGGVTNSFLYGNPGDVPFVGDWDCDGVDTPGLYRQSDGFVYLRNSNTQGIADIRFFFGNPGDFPLAGDFNNDGCDTVSIYRAAEARIYVINALGANDGGLGAAEFSYVFGNPGDKPFVGDFNGDGIDTVGLHRESTGFVYFRNSHTQGNADNEFFFGDPGDRLVAGDWGVVDGTDTPAVFRPSNTTFFFRHTNTQGNADQTLTVGSSTFLPVAGRWGQSDNTVTPPTPPTPPPAPTISGPLPNALINYPYSATLTKSGGQAPVTVQKISGPAWVSVSSAGVVSGTPPTTGTVNVGVRITDALGRTSTATVPIAVRTGCEGAGAALQTQCLALVELYRSTNGSGWLESTGWLAGNPCTVPWHGIECVGNNVTDIVLDDNNLIGTLPAITVLDDLSGLVVFDLAENMIEGQIPDLSLLPALNSIHLGENLFTGTVPVGLWTKANLLEINLSENEVTGSIATMTLPALTSLNLANSGLSGAIPAGLWSSTSLTSLDLSENGFTGSIDPTIGGLVLLQTLDISDNELTGLMPDTLRPLLINQGGQLANFSSSGNLCFDPETPELAAGLLALDPDWNEAGECTPPPPPI